MSSLTLTRGSSERRSTRTSRTASRLRIDDVIEIEIHGPGPGCARPPGPDGHRLATSPLMYAELGAWIVAAHFLHELIERLPVHRRLDGILHCKLERNL